VPEYCLCFFSFHDKRFEETYNTALSISNLIIICTTYENTRPFIIDIIYKIAFWF
jgi:hypothetical protein